MRQDLEEESERNKHLIDIVAKHSDQMLYEFHLTSGTTRPWNSMSADYENVIKEALISAEIEEMRLTVLRSSSARNAEEEKNAAFVRENGSIKSQQAKDILKVSRPIVNKFLHRINL